MSTHGASGLPSESNDYYEQPGVESTQGQKKQDTGFKTVGKVGSELQKRILALSGGEILSQGSGAVQQREPPLTPKATPPTPPPPKSSKAKVLPPKVPSRYAKEQEQIQRRDARIEKLIDDLASSQLREGAETELRNLVAERTAAKQAQFAQPGQQVGAIEEPHIIQDKLLMIENIKSKANEFFKFEDLVNVYKGMLEKAKAENVLSIKDLSHK